MSIFSLDSQHMKKCIHMVYSLHATKPKTVINIQVSFSFSNFTHSTRKCNILLASLNGIGDFSLMMKPAQLKQFERIFYKPEQNLPQFSLIYNLFMH